MGSGVDPPFSAGKSSCIWPHSRQTRTHGYPGILTRCPPRSFIPSGRMLHRGEKVFRGPCTVRIVTLTDGSARQNAINAVREWLNLPEGIPVNRLWGAMIPGKRCSFQRLQPPGFFMDPPGEEEDRLQCCACGPGKNSRFTHNASWLRALPDTSRLL